MDEIAEVEPLVVFRALAQRGLEGEPNAHAMTFGDRDAGGPSLRARTMYAQGLRLRRGFVSTQSQAASRRSSTPTAILRMLL